MKLVSFTAIATALEGAAVRYLIAGGLAVNAYGYLRFTKDVDIVVQLIPENIQRAFAALRTLGFRPFADADTRAGWIRDKHMQVLQFWSDEHLETPIDMFVTEPFPFDEEYQRALVKPLYGSIDIRFVTLPTLIRMKQIAGRPHDLNDIENLKMRVGGDAGK